MKIPRSAVSNGVDIHLFQARGIYLCKKNRASAKIANFKNNQTDKHTANVNAVLYTPYETRVELSLMAAISSSDLGSNVLYSKDKTMLIMPRQLGRRWTYTVVFPDLDCGNSCFTSVF